MKLVTDSVMPSTRCSGCMKCRKVLSRRAWIFVGVSSGWVGLGEADGWDRWLLVRLGVLRKEGK